MNDLPSSALKVAHALAEVGLEASIIQMPVSTRTAEEAAEACRCSVSQIVKSLVFQGKTTQSPVLLLVSGTNRVDEKAMARIVGEKLVRPDADYVRRLTGFAIGGIPPLAHANPLRTFVDEDLLRHDVVWAAAGNPNCVFSCDPRRLVGCVGAEVVRVC